MCCGSSGPPGRGRPSAAGPSRVSCWRGHLSVPIRSATALLAATILYVLLDGGGPRRSGTPTASSGSYGGNPAACASGSVALVGELGLRGGLRSLLCLVTRAPSSPRRQGVGSCSIYSARRAARSLRLRKSVRTHVLPAGSQSRPPAICAPLGATAISVVGFAGSVLRRRTVVSTSSSRCARASSSRSRQRRGMVHLIRPIILFLIGFEHLCTGAFSVVGGRSGRSRHGRRWPVLVVVDAGSSVSRIDPRRAPTAQMYDQVLDSCWPGSGRRNPGEEHLMSGGAQPWAISWLRSRLLPGASAAPEVVAALPGGQDVTMSQVVHPTWKRSPRPRPARRDPPEANLTLVHEDQAAEGLYASSRPPPTPLGSPPRPPRRKLLLDYGRLPPSTACAVPSSKAARAPSRRLLQNNENTPPRGASTATGL